MAVSFSDIWNAFLYNTEEDPSEAYVLLQDAPLVPENEQPVDDLNTTNSPTAEVSDTEMLATEKVEIVNLESSAETAAPNLPDDGQIEVENEQSELAFVATDPSTFITEQIADETPSSNGEIRHSFPLESDEDRQSSSASLPCSTEDNSKPSANSPVAEASDTESSNTEKEKIGDLDSIAETAAPNLPDDSQIEAENFVATDASCPTVQATDESADSNGETIVDEDHESSSTSSSPAEDKLSKKLFLYDTTAAIIGLVVPILAIGFGAVNIGNCPVCFYIPILVLIMGILSLFLVSYPLWKTTRQNFDCWTEKEEDVIFMASHILVVLWFSKSASFHSMDASFDLSEENYCNHAFYIFNIFLDIFLVLGMIIGSSLFVLNSKRRASSPTREDDDDWMNFN